MGWFNAVMAVWGDNPTFSSPSGVGLVPPVPVVSLTTTRFSSPSGVGLVPMELLAEFRFDKIFVPEWGWVGS